MGFLVGPTMHLLVSVYPELVLQAVLYTATAFTSFTAISMFSKRRSFLFVGGILASLVQGMIMYRIFGWLFGWQTYNLTYLLFGLLIGCLYIIYDTQMIVERAERGDKDEISHAMILFVDLFELFIRILQILLELQKNEEAKKKKDKK